MNDTNITEREKLESLYTESNDFFFIQFLLCNSYYYNFKVDEIFKKIKEFPQYRISNYGNVISEKRGSFKLLKPSKGSNTYLQVVLTANFPDKKVTKLLHVLVAEAFIPNPEGKKCVDHINHNRHDNRVENLRWTTQSQNLQNKSKHKNNTSGITGVVSCNEKWIAQICLDYKNMYLGTFTTKEDAVKARQEAENKYFGEYANRTETALVSI